ncbi:MAG TPA: hypothetical protein VN855_00410 [Candidatus Acidoferrum sp.]|nr:hypothetical protein [Candidatus Acidoferrum sp.]
MKGRKENTMINNIDDDDGFLVDGRSAEEQLKAALEHNDFLLKEINELYDAIILLKEELIKNGITTFADKITKKISDMSHEELLEANKGVTKIFNKTVKSSEAIPMATFEQMKDLAEENIKEAIESSPLMKELIDIFTSPKKVDSPQE